VPGESLLDCDEPGSELIGLEWSAPKLCPLPTNEIFRMAWGESYQSAHVHHIEAKTFEDLFAKICEEPSIPNGHGPYVCAPMCDGTRNAKNAQPTRVVLLDYDKLSPSEADRLRDAVKAMGVCSAIWSTRSSTPTEPHRRVMVALSALVTPAEYPLVHKALASAVNFTAGGEISVDPSSGRAEQPQIAPLAKSELMTFFGSQCVPFDVGAPLDSIKSAPLVTIASDSISKQPAGEWPSDPLVAAAKAKGLYPQYVSACTPTARAVE
jgi:hypothetical protein